MRTSRLLAVAITFFALITKIAAPVFAASPDIGYQPNAPLQITRCAVKLTIDRSGDTKTLRYLHQMVVKNASSDTIAAADFSVIGVGDDGPIASMDVTTTFNKPLHSNEASTTEFRSSHAMNRYSESTAWDLVNKFKCTVSRVHFADRKVWKDLRVIALAADASPEVCTADSADGGVAASSCAEPSQMTSSDVETYDNLSQPSARPATRPAKSPTTIAEQKTSTQRTQASHITSCTEDAKIVGKAVEPQYPDEAQEAGAVGTALVKVLLDASGTVTGASIVKSAGNEYLDQAAMKAAQATTYAAPIVNCKPTSGSFVFQADFSAT